MSAFLLVSAGGFLGANVRYGISVWSARRFGTGFPVGTLIANLGGSFLIGLVMGLLAGWFDDDKQARLLLATGFLGSGDNLLDLDVGVDDSGQGGANRPRGPESVRQCGVGPARGHGRSAARLLPDERPVIVDERNTTEETRRRPIASAWMGAVPTVLAIGVGGIIGANLRWKLGAWAVNQWATPFPWGTLLINLSGSFILGLYLTLITGRFTGRPLTRLFFATGVLGAYTTFSTFAYETVRLIQHGETWTALAYVTTSFAFGLAACAGGITIGRAI